MYNFKFEIRVDEVDGRPYIYPDDDSLNQPEHRFMFLEGAKYILSDLYQRKMMSGGIDDTVMEHLKNSLDLMHDISIALGDLVIGSQKSLDEVNAILNSDNAEDSV